MKKQIKARIIKLKDEIEQLEVKWDKLDSTGMVELQNKIIRSMIDKANEIKELRILLGILESL